MNLIAYRTCKVPSCIYQTGKKPQRSGVQLSRDSSVSASREPPETSNITALRYRGVEGGDPIFPVWHILIESRFIMRFKNHIRHIKSTVNPFPLLQVAITYFFVINLFNLRLDYYFFSFPKKLFTFTYPEGYKPFFYNTNFRLTYPSGTHKKTFLLPWQNEVYTGRFIFHKSFFLSYFLLSIFLAAIQRLIPSTSS